MPIVKLKTKYPVFLLWLHTTLSFCNLVDSLKEENFNPYTNGDMSSSASYKFCQPSNTKSLFNLDLNPSQTVQCFEEFATNGKLLSKADYAYRADQIIANHGYNFSIYDNITSSDGYIQTMFRITGSPKSLPRKGKPSVLLLHGMTSSSEQWLLLGDKSLPFVLADAGFEVWLSNYRGTDYSQKHVNMNADIDFKYWDFSFHEIAAIDVPLYVDLMIRETGTEKVFIIGHSLGGLIASIALAENAELNNKIHAAFLYGPYIIPRHPSRLFTLVLTLLNFPPEVSEFILNNIIMGRVPVGNWLLNRAYASICSATALNCGFCGTLLSLAGFNHGQFNYTQIPNFASRIFNTASMKTLLHTFQMRVNCRLAKYDYGPVKNFHVYGRRRPPVYNLNRVRAHLYVYYGGNDTFTTPEDQEIFVNAFPKGTVQVFERVNATVFDHTAVINDKNAYKVLYNYIIKDMNKYVVSQ